MDWLDRCAGCCRQAMPGEGSALSDGYADDANDGASNERSSQGVLQEDNPSDDRENGLQQREGCHTRHRAPGNQPEPQAPAGDRAEQDGVREGQP